MVIDFNALAVVLCHRRAGRLAWQQLSKDWNRDARQYEPERWEASAWVKPEWSLHRAPSVPALLATLYEHLNRPSYPLEAAALEAAADDVRLVLSPRGCMMEIERWGDSHPAQRLGVRYRVSLDGMPGRTVWCNGDSPALMFRCAAMVLRGELSMPVHPCLEMELPALAGATG